VGCQLAGSLGALGSKLPVLGWRKMGCPGAVTVQRPKSGSRKTRLTRSKPSREEDGREEEVGSGGGVNMVRSSKVKRGSGKRSN
jgi:hypothetical protein